MNKEMCEFLFAQLGSKPELWAKRVYTGTDCGAWLSVKENTVTFGSIVEGSTYDVNPRELTWPFTTESFWGALEEIDKEANRIWNETHGCDVCAEKWGFTDDNGFQVEGCDGVTPVHPECTSCEGYGVVI